MTESVTDLREVFFGLEEYFGFCSNLEESLVTRELGKVYSAEDFKSALFAAYIKILFFKSRDTDKDTIFRAINDYLKKDNAIENIQDAMSRSQMRSKIWLVEELAKIRPAFANVVLLAGWFGQLRFILEQEISFVKLRNVELDKDACEISDYVFNLYGLKDHKIKSVNADINGLTLHKNGYEWDIENFKEETKYSEKFLPDLIINTSAEHMTEEWFHQLRFKQLDSDPVVAIQSNNLFDIPEHINCVHSVDHMMKKFPMREVIFAGELQLKGYKRVMLIGRP
jgi:hypothetical protein